MGESYLIDQNKIATGVELEIISPNEQELKIDALVGCFVNKCNFNLNEVVYVSNQIIYSKQPLEISKFALLQFRDQQSRIFYSMNRMPFNLNSEADIVLKRVSKILILIWYLAVIKNANTIFTINNTAIITNLTNGPNYGFSKKVFGDKISYVLDEDYYSWEIKVGDFLETEARIRELLKAYLFEKTRYCDMLCFLTPGEMDLIEQHC